MILSLAFAFASCADKEYEDTVVTIPVTDENGLEVTDADGYIVTEVVTEDDESQEASASSENESNSGKTSSSDSEKKDNTSNADNKTTAAASDNNNGGKTSTTKKNTSETEKNENTSTTKKNAATTEKKETTTQTTTKKPEKRKVSVSVVLPYYNDQETNLSVSYRVEGEEKYTKLEFPDPADSKNKLTYETVKLDGKTVKTYELGEFKGYVVVTIGMTGVDISANSVKIPATESTGEIKPYTGIEVMIGDDF